VLHRKPLLDLLDRYATRHPDEAARVARFRALVASRPDCFARTCLPGHVTASAWIFSADRRRFLLGHHRKLDRWLQLGGHADGETDVARVALREACEESGLDGLVFLGADGEPGEPFVVDVDVHAIPARPGEPAHAHHDVRFVLVAPAGAEPRASHESHALAWFALDELEHLEARGADESLLRLGRKARALAARG
jgi:8-oxo-dGTP pyrophosphatase MutT (NUDIX family)